MTFHPDRELKGFTTLRIGGKASGLCLAKTEFELLAAAYNSETQKKSWKVLGEGSNVLVSDEGTPKNIIIYRQDPSDLAPISPDGTLEISGAASLKQVLRQMAHQGLAGLEDLYGIPGTVGGAIAGNAGAYGVAISDHLLSAKVLFPGGEVRLLSKEDFDFRYRSSIIKCQGGAILSAIFKLQQAPAIDLLTRQDERMADRRAKHPNYLEIPTAGSWFKNPEGTGERRTSAGKLLEECGCKQLQFGGAFIWPLHANILVTDGTATACDVKNLSDEMKKRVFEKFGISLEQEVCWLD